MQGNVLGTNYPCIWFLSRNATPQGLILFWAAEVGLFKVSIILLSGKNGICSHGMSVVFGDIRSHSSFSFKATVGVYKVSLFFEVRKCLALTFNNFQI